MPRLQPVDPATASGATKELFDLVEQRFGRIPNAMKMLANSPAAFAAWWAFDQAMADSSLPPSVHEQVAVLTAQLNQCAYCLSAHTAAAREAGVSRDDAEQARRGAASEPQAAAALAFAANAVATRGDVSDAALSRARAAGLTDAQLIEILATVSINVFNNLYNRMADPVVDFPAVAEVAR